MGFACCAVASSSMTAWPGCTTVSVDADELSDRAGESSPREMLLDNVCQGGHGACLLYLEVLSARQASACIALATMMT